VAGDEPVTSPDQRKPVNPRKARVAAVITVVILLLLNFGNHKGRTEDLWLVGLAALIVAMLIGDWVLRRNGLRD
jgi:general stress protein CsbA